MRGCRGGGRGRQCSSSRLLRFTNTLLALLLLQLLLALEGRYRWEGWYGRGWMRGAAAGDRLIEDILLLWNAWTQAMRRIAGERGRLEWRACGRIRGRLGGTKTRGSDVRSARLRCRFGWRWRRGFHRGGSVGIPVLRWSSTPTLDGNGRSHGRIAARCHGLLLLVWIGHGGDFARARSLPALSW